MLDKFGNYIVQSFIKHSGGIDAADRELLRQGLAQADGQLRESPAGRNIISLMEKEFGTSQ